MIVREEMLVASLTYYLQNISACQTQMDCLLIYRDILSSLYLLWRALDAWLLYVKIQGETLEIFYSMTQISAPKHISQTCGLPNSLATDFNRQISCLQPKFGLGSPVDSCQVSTNEILKKSRVIFVPSRVFPKSSSFLISILAHKFILA